MSEPTRFCPLCALETTNGECPSDGAATIPRALFVDAKEDPWVGCLIGGRYEVSRVLGSGAMGRVYEATDRREGQQVALKTTRLDQDVSPQDVVRLFREGRSASRIESRHVVKVFDVGFDEGWRLPFIVMEVLEGMTLSDLLKAEGPLPVERAAHLLAGAARALAEAAKHGVVHRDLKPANLFVVRDELGGELLKVADFGIAKRVDGSTDMLALTQTGQLLGTPLYMAPEQVQLEKLGPATDLYSLGCVLFEAVTGERAFDGHGAAQVLARHLSGARPRLPAILPARGEPPPESLSVLVDALLARHPEDRPRDAASVASVLEALSRGEAIDAHAELGLALQPVDRRGLEPADLAATDNGVGPPPSVTARVATTGETQASAPANRRRGVWIASGVLALGVVVWLFTRPPGSPSTPAALPMSPPASPIGSDPADLLMPPTRTQQPSAHDAGPVPSPTAPIDARHLARPAVAESVIHAEPKAVVFYEGVSLGATPVTVRRPEGTSVIELTVKARGHAPKTIVLEASSPEELSVRLTPSPPGKPRDPARDADPPDARPASPFREPFR